MIGFSYSEWAVSLRAKLPLLNFILDGLTSSGCTILYASSPARAPFLVTYETAAGEREGVLVYAFLANSVLTRNRPVDEHRFQVKYGSDTAARLAIEQDPAQLVTTIFVGIDTERGVMIGADPVLHDGTAMFISVEFKRGDFDRVVARGWHAWERDSRRSADEPVEVLVGVKQDRLLDFLRFERLAMGLDPGHRQLLAESAFRGSSNERPPVATTHSLLKELALPESELFDLIHGARRLKMAVRGWVAEVHLEKLIKAVPGVEECTRLDGDGQPDLAVRYKGSRPILIECKNVLRARSADGLPRVDFQRTRASQSDSCSRYYRPTDFSLLAACLHAVTERWEYRFVPTSSLPAHSRCAGRINSNLKVGHDWHEAAGAALAKVAVHT